MKFRFGSFWFDLSRQLGKPWGALVAWTDACLDCGGRGWNVVIERTLVWIAEGGRLWVGVGGSVWVGGRDLCSVRLSPSLCRRLSGHQHTVPLTVSSQGTPSSTTVTQQAPSSPVPGGTPADALSRQRLRQIPHKAQNVE